MSQQMRQEFEMWFSANAPKMNAKACERDAKAVAVKEMAFCSWVASRETLVIKLPDRPYASETDQEQMSDYEIGEGHGGIAEWDKCRDAIHAAGAKTR